MTHTQYKIRNRTQRTDIGKYSFLNKTIKNWHHLPAGLLASLPCKVNKFRKKVKNVVTSKGIAGNFVNHIYSKFYWFDFV
jgi:hypothetical protein